MAKKSTKSNRDIYQEVTDIIISALERGVVPWHRPWSLTRKPGQMTLHMNMVTKKPYRGINQFLCEIQAVTNGYASNLWLSRKQIMDRGGKIMAGEKGTLITFWKPIVIDTGEKDDKGQPVRKKIPLLKHYFVWNFQQTEGVKLPKAFEVTEEPVEEQEEEFSAIEIAQAIIDNMPNRPTIHHRGDRAFYRPALDDVTLPEPTAFHSPEEYYNTAYHELVHATGHESRLHAVTDWTSFGSDPYANEELRAELGAAMLMGAVGITVTHEQSAAYIKSWVGRLKNDKKLIVQAAGKAQKAADYIQGISFENEAPVAEKELAHV